MPPVYENDLVLATTFIKHASLPRMTCVTYALVDGTANESAQAWADFLQSAFVNRWESRLNEECSMVKTTTLKGDGSETFETGESTAPPSPGLLNIAAVQANTAVLIKKLTAFGGRRNRGRMYFPWMMPDGDCDELGNLNSARVAGLQATADDWLDDLDEPTTGAHMVIANRVYDLPWNDPARQLIEVNAGPQVTALVVESIAATQRRRMPR